MTENLVFMANNVAQLVIVWHKYSNWVFGLESSMAWDMAILPVVIEMSYLISMKNVCSKSSVRGE